MRETGVQPPSLPKTSFPVVGIGASAGGLRAIEEMLKHLPPDTGMAFVIVQHLSPKYKSLMQDILTKDTPMPVVMAEAGMAVQPDHIYLIPPGRNLTVHDYRLQVETQQEDRVPPFVIDLFFHSLGQDVGAQSVGVILSGTGSDGSRGVRTIKEQGGVVIVQAPQSSEFDGMTISAIKTQTADYVLDPADIARQLVTLAQAWRKGLAGASPPETHPKEGQTDGLTAIEHTLVHQILRLVQRSFGTDFSQYKPSTVMRRLEKAMIARQVDSFQAYYEGMVRHPEWREELFHELLIGVTEFFRDTGAFDVLRQEVIPALMERYTYAQEIRIWVCGCSTGEEAYSLAILCREYETEHGIYPKVKILATDVDDRALNVASRGIYSRDRLSNLSPAQIERHFLPQGERFEVKKTLRDRIIFARNDATVDPPFINLDLIACRNLLIYLQPEIQRRLLQNFHFGLKSDGFLMLGASENVLDMTRHFNPVSERWKIFRSQGPRHHPQRSYAWGAQEGTPERTPRTYGSRPVTELRPRYADIKPKLNYSKLLLRHYAPSAILLDWDFRVLFLTGKAHEYLKLPEMEPSTHIFDMVPTAVGVVLRDALEQLREAPEQVFAYQEVGLQRLGKDCLAKLRIGLLPTGDEADALILVEIEDEPLASPGQEVNRQGPASLSPNVEEIIRGLQEDLHLAEMEIQNVMEELETSNEELQASNEELLASNEELQSTNEELQSLNEELHTVNSELQARNEQISEAKATIDNMLSSTQLGTLFLDEKMQVRLFTMSVRDVFPLTTQDIGRPIGQFASRLDYPELIADAQQVVDSGEIAQREVPSQDGRWFLVRHTPFRKGPNQIGGVVLTFMDISERKAVELSLSQNEQLFRSIVESTNDRISVVSPTGKLLFANWASGQDLSGASFFDHLTGESREKAQVAIQEVVESKESRSFVAELMENTGKKRWYSKNLTPLLTHDSVTRIAILGRDITAQVELSAILGTQVTTFKEFMDRSPMLAWIKDDQFRYVYVNRAYRDVIDIATEKFIGHTDYDLYAEDIAAQYRANDEEVVRTGKVIYAHENVRQPEQELEYLISMKFPLFVGTSKTYVAGIGVDITDLKRSERSAVEAREALEQLVEVRTAKIRQTTEEIRTLTRAIAHDLRGPLEAVLHACEELVAASGASQAPHLTQIKGLILRMSRLVESLHYFARIGHAPLRETEIDMRGLFQACYQDLAYLRQGRAVIWEIGDMPPAIGDQDLLNQVVTNLLGNALKYTQDQNPARLSVGGEALPTEGYLRYWVRDNGPGIAAEDQVRVFNVFERLGVADEVPGHGVGLSIVKRAVEIHGGQVGVDSAPGEGSTFFFTIPYLPADQ